MISLFKYLRVCVRKGGDRGNTLANYLATGGKASELVTAITRGRIKVLLQEMITVLNLR